MKTKNETIKRCCIHIPMEPTYGYITAPVILPSGDILVGSYECCEDCFVSIVKPLNPKVFDERQRVALIVDGSHYFKLVGNGLVFSKV